MSGRLHRSIARTLAAAGVTLALSAGVTLPAAPALAASTCNSGYVATDGKYWVNNNLWGAGSGSGWQCTWDGYISGDTMGWGTTWNWSGGQNQVKSYASAVLGWQWGWQVQNTGLPVRIWDNRSVNSSWNFSVTQTTANTMNVSYDLWFHDQSNPGSSSTPAAELMVWPYRSGGAGPVGTRQATVWYAGANWDLYRGNVGWDVYSFVRQSNSTNVSLNLRDFINEVVYNRGWMSNSRYLTSVQAGTEVFTGTGRLDTNSYSVAIS